MLKCFIFQMEVLGEVLLRFYLPWFILKEAKFYISLLLTSFPTLGTGFQLCLREFFHAAQSSFPCGSEHFSLRVRALSMRVRALSMRLRNQASKTKCQHSSSLMSSIKKRNLWILKEIQWLSRDLNLGPLAQWVNTLSIELSSDGWRKGLFVQLLIWLAGRSNFIFNSFIWIRVMYSIKIVGK